MRGLHGPTEDGEADLRLKIDLPTYLSLLFTFTVGYRAIHRAPPPSCAAHPDGSPSLDKEFQSCHESHNLF